MNRKYKIQLRILSFNSPIQVETFLAGYTAGVLLSPIQYILYRRKNLLYSYKGGPKHTKAPIFYILVDHTVVVVGIKYFFGAMMPHK